MGSHPLNLALRFLLELVAIGAVGFWGWRATDSPALFAGNWPATSVNDVVGPLCRS